MILTVLYGCETWSLTLGQEHKLRMSHNKVPREIFVPERGEVTGEWRRPYNEGLYYMYSSPNVIRVIKSRIMRWAGHMKRVGEVHTGLWLGNLKERANWKS